MHEDNDEQAPAGKRQLLISQAASISAVQDAHNFLAVQQKIH
jgi:hypothetical protein